MRLAPKPLSAPPNDTSADKSERTRGLTFYQLHLLLDKCGS
jgi:hypothetical protein